MLCKRKDTPTQYAYMCVPCRNKTQQRKEDAVATRKHVKLPVYSGG
jgi:hypothetical protein